MRPYAALILAAGKGTRMKSKVCKVLHTIAGRPMISYVIDAVRLLGFERIVLVVGHQADEVQKSISPDGLEFVLQSRSLALVMRSPPAPGALEILMGTL